MALLVVLEGLLSIDNALVLGLLGQAAAQERAGQGPAGMAWPARSSFASSPCCTASLLLRWTFVKFLGGAYLVYIAVRHLFFESKEKEDEKIVLDEHGHPKLVEEETGGELTAEQEEDGNPRARAGLYDARDAEAARPGQLLADGPRHRADRHRLRGRFDSGGDRHGRQPAAGAPARCAVIRSCGSSSWAACSA